MRYTVIVAYGEDNVDKATISLTLANAALDGGDEVSAILMSEGVRLAVGGYADALDNGEPFKPVKVLVEAILAKGGDVFVCVPCLKNRGLLEDDADDRVQRIAGAEVIRVLKESDRTIQL